MICYFGKSGPIYQSVPQQTRFYLPVEESLSGKSPGEAHRIAVEFNWLIGINRCRKVRKSSNNALEIEEAVSELGTTNTELLVLIGAPTV